MRGMSDAFAIGADMERNQWRLKIAKLAERCDWLASASQQDAARAEGVAPGDLQDFSAAMTRMCDRLRSILDGEDDEP